MPHTSIQPLKARRMPSKQISLRQLFDEMNIGYTIQADFKTNEEVGFYCIATSYLRKDNAMQRVGAFIKSNLLPYDVIDGSGLTFYIHEK